MLKRLKIYLTVAFFTLGLGTKVDAASLNVFTDRSTWESSMVSFSTETFAIADTGELAAGITHSLGSVDFYYEGAPRFGTPNVSSGSFLGNVYQTAYGGGTTRPGDHLFSFPNMVTAWGADFSNTTVNALLTVSMAGYTIEFDNYLLDGNGNGFLGIISSVSFDNILFSVENTPLALNELFYMDNLSYGNAIPEPTSLILLGSGLTILGLATHRRRRK